MLNSPSPRPLPGGLLLRSPALRGEGRGEEKCGGKNWKNFVDSFYYVLGKVLNVVMPRGGVVENMVETPGGQVHVDKNFYRGKRNVIREVFLEFFGLFYGEVWRLF